MLSIGLGRTSLSLGIDRCDTYSLHQSVDFVSTDTVSIFLQVPVDHPIPQSGAFGVEFIDPAHQAQIVGIHSFRPIVEAAAIEVQQAA